MTISKVRYIASLFLHPARIKRTVLWMTIGLLLAILLMETTGTLRVVVLVQYAFFAIDLIHWLIVEVGYLGHNVVGRSVQQTDDDAKWHYVVKVERNGESKSFVVDYAVYRVADVGSRYWGHFAPYYPQDYFDTAIPDVMEDRHDFERAIRRAKRADESPIVTVVPLGKQWAVGGPKRGAPAYAVTCCAAVEE